MRHSTKPPTKPGWYWAREPDELAVSDLGPQIVSVHDIGGGAPLLVLMDGDDRAFPLDHFHDWTGPLSTDAVEPAELVPLLREVGEPGACSGCGAAVHWVMHRSGKRVPYTARGVNHFVDCPKAAEFRRRTP